MISSLKEIKRRIEEISSKIDKIVASGGRVCYGDPLSREFRSLRLKLTCLQKPRLPGVRK